MPPSRPSTEGVAGLADTRLFLTLTLAEASALLRRDLSPARTRAIAKIQTAVEGAAPRRVQTAEQCITAVKPLRLHDYHPRRVALRRRNGVPDPPAIVAIPDDDYVPYRDEAGGAYT